MECRGWRSAAERFERKRKWEQKPEQCVTSEMLHAVAALREFFASDDWQAASWLLAASMAKPIKIARERTLERNGVAETQHFLTREGIRSFLAYNGASRKFAATPEEVIAAWAFSWSASPEQFLPWLCSEIDNIAAHAPRSPFFVAFKGGYVGARRQSAWKRFLRWLAKQLEREIW